MEDKLLEVEIRQTGKGLAGTIGNRLNLEREKSSNPNEIGTRGGKHVKNPTGRKKNKQQGRLRRGKAEPVKQVEVGKRDQADPEQGPPDDHWGLTSRRLGNQTR